MDWLIKSEKAPEEHGIGRQTGHSVPGTEVQHSGKSWLTRAEKAQVCWSEHSPVSLDSRVVAVL